MHLVLSGEGPSDIGLFSYGDNVFIPGAMYYIVDKIIEQKYSYSFLEITKELITFIPKAELMQVCKSMPSFAGKKKEKETNYFYKNAKGLAKIAKEECIKRSDEDVIAILFRDSDGTNTSPSALWNIKIESIENGFESEKFDKGIAMIPKPKSESWLLCALKSNKYQNCTHLEASPGNDDSPNGLKKELEKILNTNKKEYSDICEMIKNNEIEIDKIDMPSFIYFVESLKKLL